MASKKRTFVILTEKNEYINITCTKLTTITTETNDLILQGYNNDNLIGEWDWNVLVGWWESNNIN